MKRLSLACFALLAAGAFGQHWVEYGVNLSLGWQYLEDYKQGAEPTGEIHHVLTEPGYGNVEGWANVGFGVNKARVDLSGTNADNPLNFEYGFATSRYFDVMQFDDPNLNGTVGTFETTLFMHGSGYFNPSSSLATNPSTEIDAFWHAVINVTVDGITDPFGSPIQSAYYAGEWYKGIGETEVGYYGDPLNTYQTTATFSFIYGQPIYLDTFLQTYISIDNQAERVNGTIDASIDLGNTAYWGGIRNMRDANGRLVSNAAYSSSSGFDYRLNVVPEPGTVGVLSLGAAFLFRRRRRAG